MIRSTFIVLFLSIFVFTGCFEEEKKPRKKRKPVERMAQKVIKNVKEDKPLSKVVEDDGIVVDGARDEKLLDAFGLAVSQVMINEGVSVPDCDALSKTGFLSKEECEEITDKYTGFYEVTEDGELVKVDNVFSKGIEGKGVELGEGIEFFDSTGNPLLENEVEFNEYVANTDDVGLLTKLKAKIPTEKIEMLKNVEQKIEFLEEVQKAQTQTIDEKQTKKNDVEVDNNTNNTQTNQNTNGYSGIDNESANDMSRLSALKAKRKKVQEKLILYPDSTKYLLELEELNIEISYLESKLGL